MLQVQTVLLVLVVREVIVTFAVGVVAAPVFVGEV